MKKRILCAILAVMSMGILASCKGGEESIPEGSPDASLPQEYTSDNPVVIALAAYFEKKDISYGKCAMVMDEAVAEDTEKQPLVQSLELVFSQTDIELYELMTNAVEMKKNGEVWSVNANGKTGETKQEGNVISMNCTYSEQVAEEGEEELVTASYRNSVTYDNEKETIVAQVFMVPADGTSEVETAFMECKKDGEAYIAQYWYSTDEGENYAIVRTIFDGNTIAYSVVDTQEKEDTKRKPDSILEMDTEQIFEGADTVVRYDGSKVTINNEGKTYVLGE